MESSQATKFISFRETAQKLAVPEIFRPRDPFGGTTNFTGIQKFSRAGRFWATKLYSLFQYLESSFASIFSTVQFERMKLLDARSKVRREILPSNNGHGNERSQI